jgi:hypothetical protein
VAHQANASERVSPSGLFPQVQNVRAPKVHNGKHVSSRGGILIPISEFDEVLNAFLRDM